MVYLTTHGVKVTANIDISKKGLSVWQVPDILDRKGDQREVSLMDHSFKCLLKYRNSSGINNNKGMNKVPWND